MELCLAYSQRFYGGISSTLARDFIRKCFEMSKPVLSEKKSCTSWKVRYAYCMPRCHAIIVAPISGLYPTVVYLCMFVCIYVCVTEEKWICLPEEGEEV